MNTNKLGTCGILVALLGIGMGAAAYVTTPAAAEPIKSQPEVVFQNYPIKTDYFGATTRIRDTELGNVCYFYLKGDKQGFSCVNDISINTVPQETGWTTIDQPN